MIMYEFVDIWYMGSANKSILMNIYPLEISCGMLWNMVHGGDGLAPSR